MMLSNYIRLDRKTASVKKGAHKMKLTKKQIEIIRQNTPAEIVGKQRASICAQYLGEFGYYQPNGVNWAYIAEYIQFNGQPLLIVTQFGEIMGGANVSV